MTATVNIRLKMRGRLAADWTSGNEVLLAREIGVETDTNKFKFGDGTTAWNSLAYVGQPLDADLTALAGNSTNGLWARTGAGTGAARTLTGTANEITATNGDGVSGNPTFSLPAALTFTSKTVTGGTFSGITLSGTTTGPGGFSVDSAGQVNGGGSNAWTIGTKNAANRIDIVSSIYRFLTSANNFAAIQTGGIDIVADVLRLRTAKTPATSGAAGNAGDIAWDANYFYVCTATNTWRRVAHATW